MDFERVLVIQAHPDDVDFGMAGTVATWTAAGTDVRYCLVTSGDNGGFDDTPRDQMTGLREREQRNAAAEVGVHDIDFLRYPDGQVTVSMDLRRDLSRVIRRQRPQLVVQPSPERMWARLPVSHPDHMATGEAAIRAVYPDARNPFAHPELLADEGLEAWTVPTVWLSGHPESNHWVDVTDVLDRKFAALHCHVSQNTGGPELEKRLREGLAANARAGGLPEGRYAESFFTVQIG